MINLYAFDSWLLALILFIGILLFYVFGLRASFFRKKKDPDYHLQNLTPFVSAMLGLISLLLAFTFNQSANYYNTRRELILQESNSIGTVLLRADMYPPSERDAFRRDLKSYIHERIYYYQVGESSEAISSSIQRSTVLSNRIWKRAALLAQKDDVVVKSMQMIPAINEMIDMVGAREEARLVRISQIIIWLLGFSCLWGSFIVGYTSKSNKTDWIIVLSYALLTVMTFYVILDLDQARTGLIDTHKSHESMTILVDSF